MKPRAFNGWALSILISYDEIHPGILRFAMAAGPLRRQATFLVLSSCHHEGPEGIASRLGSLIPHAGTADADPRARVAQVLMTRQIRVRDLVRVAYGPLEGLVGVLGRLGTSPLHPATYRTIVSILSQPEHRVRAKILRQMDKVAPSMPAVLLALKPPFVLTNLVEGLRSVEQVADFKTTIDLILSLVPQVTELELAKSLADVKPEKLDDWAMRWLDKAGLFPVSPPICDNGDFAVLGSAQAMQEAAARFNNCLATKIRFCVVGRQAYVEYLPEPAIIEVLSLSPNHWLLTGIYGPNNRPIDTATAHTIHRKLEAAGILSPARVAQAKPYNAVARLLGISQFDGLELDVLEEDAGPDDLQAIVNEVARELHAA